MLVIVTNDVNLMVLTLFCLLELAEINIMQNVTCVKKRISVEKFELWNKNNSKTLSDH